MDQGVRIAFPRYIDKPKMIGIFEMDEAMLGLVPLVVIMLIGFIKSYDSTIIMIIGFLLWFITGLVIHKFKENNPNGYMYHFFYRQGIYHPVMSNVKLQVMRKDIKDGSKIVPTGIVRVFVN